jgi:hypothetical protein
MVALRRLGLPRPARVELDTRGDPVRIDGRAVETLRARWVVEEGWWTDAPIRRRYLEAVLADGRLAVVYEDLVAGGWHAHGGSLRDEPRARPRGA